MSSSQLLSEFEFLFSVANDIFSKASLILEVERNNNSKVIGNVLYWYLDKKFGYARIDVERKTLHLYTSVGSNGSAVGLVRDSYVAGQVANHVVAFLMVLHFSNLPHTSLNALIAVTHSGLASEQTRKKLENAGLIYRGTKAFWLISKGEYFCIQPILQEVFKVTSFTSPLLAENRVSEEDVLIPSIMQEIVRAMNPALQITTGQSVEDTFQFGTLFSFS
jgi:hypothetical protein